LKGTILQSLVHLKKYLRYSGAIPQLFEPMCVRVAHASAFSQAFPPTVLLQHCYVGNESTQDWFDWRMHFLVRFVCAVIPNYVVLNCHRITASFFRKHPKSSGKEASKINVLKLPK